MQTKPPDALFDYPTIFDNSLDEKGPCVEIQELETY